MCLGMTFTFSCLLVILLTGWLPNVQGQCSCSTHFKCPKTPRFTGECHSGTCPCAPGYHHHEYGCRGGGSLTPRVSLGGRAHYGEARATVTATCNPSNYGDGNYGWFVNGRWAPSHNSTYTFLLEPRTYNIRCLIVLGGHHLAGPSLSPPLVGSTCVGQLSTPTTVEGIPEVALNNTRVDLTCGSIPFIRGPELECIWKVGGQIVAQGFGLYTLRGFQITTENAGQSIICYVDDGNEPSYDSSGRLPSIMDDDIPDVLIEGESKYAEKGQSVTLKCILQGQPYPDDHPDIAWSWRRNDVTQPGLSTSEIVLPSVLKGTHAGEWKCVAKYQIKPAKVSPAVNLHIGALRATIRSLPAVPLVNAVLELRCETSFAHDVHYTYEWYFNGALLPEYTDSSLFFRLRPYYKGRTYKCAVKVDHITAFSNDFTISSLVRLTDSPPPVLQIDRLDDSVPGEPASPSNDVSIHLICNANSSWTSFCMEFEFFRDGVSVRKSPEPILFISKDTGDVIERKYTCRTVLRNKASSLSNIIKDGPPPTLP